MASGSGTGYHEELESVESELAAIEVNLQVLLERQSELLDKQAELKALIEQSKLKDKQVKDETFWSKTDFKWSAEIDEKLESVFHLKELRPMQRQTMNATLSGEDALLIMPTGGGKSLCFQLPALINKGLTLVVSPLISLIDDQQMALEQLDIPSAVLNASSSKEEQKFVLDDIVNLNGSLRLLYVTPEKLAKSKRFMNRLEKCYAVGHLSRLVIDEVHCCSQWGHDFRPDYKFLGIMKRQFPNCPILGLTATATSKVLEDVKKILSIPKALVLKASFNRPNLFYEVRPKPSSHKECVDAMHDLIRRKYHRQSGIIYCFSRKDSEELTASLQSLGIKAGCYHGDMEAKTRGMVHRNWLCDDIHVVVATIAFGMGIDKPDVRFVIHHSISKSMENLYQESGRAGRDGEKADCIVFYRLADVIRQSSMVFTEQTGLANLHGIVEYSINVSRCRRALIASHFGEVWHGSQCNEMCDHCHNMKNGASVEKRDVTRHCFDIIVLLDMAASADQRVTAQKLVDAWFGKGPSVLKVKTVAVPNMSRDKAERILAYMLTKGFIQEDFHFTAYSTICYLIPGPKAKLLRNKSMKVYLDYPIKTTTKSKSGVSVSVSSPSALPTSLSSSSKATALDVGNKPKVVVINRNKSHFNCLPFPSSPQSARQEVNSEASSSNMIKTPSTDSLRKECVPKSQSLSDEDKDLNFDDDVKFERKLTARSRRNLQTKSDSGTKKEHNTNTHIVNSENDPVCRQEEERSNDSYPCTTSINASSKKLNSKAKRKHIVISDSSDDEAELINKHKEFKPLSDTSVSKLNGMDDSLIISDEDSGEEFIS